jgi:integrase
MPKRARAVKEDLDEERSTLDTLRRLVVRPDTADDYESIFEKIWQWSKNQGSPLITRDTLISFLLQKLDSKDTNRTNKVKAALDFAYALYPERFQPGEFWREHSLNHFIFRGLKELAKGRAKPPGAIDTDMFARMMTSMPFRELEIMEQKAMMLLFFGALRRTELVRMTSSDYDEKSGWLILNQNKGARTTSGEPLAYSKRVILARAKEILQELKKAHKPGTRLFTYNVAPMKALESCVKQTAAILGWDPAFRWSLHSLRHGGMQAIRDELEKSGRMHLLEESTQVSEGVRERYLRPNTERILFIQQGRLGELFIPGEREDE